MPIDEAPQMREALGLAGAGSQGDYSKTSYSLIGTGRLHQHKEQIQRLAKLVKKVSSKAKSK